MSISPPNPFLTDDASAENQAVAPKLPASEPTDGGGSHSEVARLLEAVDDAASTIGRASSNRQETLATRQRMLVEGRLGMASALFASLRCKHPATAAHSLRVALGCSTWAAALEMPDKLRTQLEAAALLHDIGKIGVADSVLLKPGRLTPAELEQIDSSREAAWQILSAAGAPDAIVEGVVSTGAWFDGSHRSLKLTGEQTPFVSRMIAIVDAFDSMTTDQVYRPARSRDRAIATLYEAAGTQFDPDLVKSYCEVFARDQSALEADVEERWLGTITGGGSSQPWETDAVESAPPNPSTQPSESGSLFQKKLIDNMHDAVVFLDANRRITMWNTGAERLTGVGASAALGTEFCPSLLDMALPSGTGISEEECPAAEAIATGLQSLERVSIVGRNGQYASVDLHVIPVRNGSEAVVGVTLLMHDASSVASLEERCQTLQAETTKDSMTQVANRAEFDRMLEAFVDAHQETGLPCSLIMSDIDHFKRINDTYGHQAGDEAIMAFASLLKSMCRSGDLVARYGGEEFAILCADCNNATATQRADQIRRKLSETQHSNLGNNRITASFGVTELQTGDTPETMLRRSDRALLQAKDQGRNQCVQLGDGMSTTEETKTGWLSLGNWFGTIGGGGALIEARLVTNVPIELAIEKLKGFIADRDARILKTAENHLRMEVVDHPAGKRRANDRPVPIIIDMQLSQEHHERSNSSGMAAGKYVHTYIETTIQPKRDRDRRGGVAIERARLMLGSIKSYLMAKEVDSESSPIEE